MSLDVRLPEDVAQLGVVGGPVACRLEQRHRFGEAARQEVATARGPGPLRAARPIPPAARRDTGQLLDGAR